MFEQFCLCLLGAEYFATKSTFIVVVIALAGAVTPRGSLRTRAVLRLLEPLTPPLEKAHYGI